MDVHDLTPAYALHALDDVERATYEAHLAQCARCREELALLTESAAALAWAVESPPPPDRLRSRILDAAAGERENVVPLRRVRPWRAVAAVAACAALGLAVWSATLSRSLDRERAHATALQIVVDPTSRKLQLRGRDGMVAVAPDGEGVLVVHHLPAAPAGMTYEAWVIPPGGSPRRAGLFEGGGSMSMLKLGEHVMKGAVVAATVEKAGGVDRPTQQPVVSAQA